MFTCQALHGYLVVTRASLTRTTIFNSRQCHYDGVEKLVQQLNTHAHMAALVTNLSICMPTHDMCNESTVAPLVTLSNGLEMFRVMDFPELPNYLELPVHICSQRKYIPMNDLLCLTARLPCLQRLILDEFFQTPTNGKQEYLGEPQPYDIHLRSNLSPSPKYGNRRARRT